MDVRSSFPGLALGWSVMLSALAANAAPPPELNTPEWSDEYRKIAPESGARITGDWNTAYAPYMYRPMMVGGVDHPAPKVWLRWSAKTGKTQVSLNVIFHCIDTAPRSVAVIVPTLQKAQDIEREVVSPSIRVTTRINAKVMATKSRAGDGSTTRHKRFRGGFLKIINGGSEAELQQSDVGLVVFEEPASFKRDVGGRGSPIKQGRQRTWAWGDDAKEIGAGTPGFVGDCMVTEETELGTFERYYVPCPHCGARQVLLWENMTLFEKRPHFVCQDDGCGCLIGHEHKLWMLAEAFSDGYPWYGWVPCFDSENPDNPAPPPCFPGEDLARWQSRDLEGRFPSFDGIWQAYSPFTHWPRIFEEHASAIKSGNIEDLVTFYQQVLGRPFESVYERPPAEALYKNREKAASIAQVARGRIPPWAWSIYLTVDTQGDRLEWAVFAYGRERRGARIDSGVIPIRPDDPRAWTELAEITQRQYEGPACRPIGFDRVGIDTGGHHTNQAYIFCSGRPNVMALKGASGAKALDALPLAAGSVVKAKIAGRVIARTQLFFVGTHKVKKEIYFGLAQTLSGIETMEHLPGSFTLEAEATEQDYKQLTAEVLLPPDPAKKRKVETWTVQPAGARNEQLDLAVYGRALAWSFLPDTMRDEDWDRLIESRRRDPARDGELPLESLWSGAAQPAAQDTVSPGSPPSSHGASEAGDAAGEATPAADPLRKSVAAPLRNPAPEHPLMRLARQNRSDDA